MSIAPPRKLWLQWYGDPYDGTGIGNDQPEGPTFNTEKVYENDVCYIRAGKQVPGKAELELWTSRAVRARAIIETLTKIIPDDATILKDSEGWPYGFMEIVAEE